MTIYWTNSVSVFVMVYFQLDKKKRWSSSHNLTRGSKCRKFKDVLGRTELMMTICDKMMRVAITRPRCHASKTIYLKLGHIYPNWNRLFPTLMVGRGLVKSWGSREKLESFKVLRNRYIWSFQVFPAVLDCFDLFETFESGLEWRTIVAIVLGSRDRLLEGR